MTLCKKCKWLWKESNHYFCIVGKSAGVGNIAYKKGKKECKCFEEKKKTFFIEEKLFK